MRWQAQRYAPCCVCAPFWQEEQVDLQLVSVKTSPVAAMARARREKVTKDFMDAFGLYVGWRLKVSAWPGTRRITLT